MTTPRRRVLRSSVVEHEIDCRHQAARRRAVANLLQARSALKRWLPRLKRALTAVAKHQQQLACLKTLVAAWQRR
jgi:hypothetical protein